MGQEESQYVQMERNGGPCECDWNTQHLRNGKNGISQSFCAFRTYRHPCAGGVALSPFGNDDGDPSHAANLRYRPSILDFQVGVGDQPYAKGAAQRAAAALKAGRAATLPVVFSKVKFRAGYRDVADSNKAFALIKMKNLFPPDASELISILQPGHDEIVVDKDRYCAFSGNDLKEACAREASSIW